MMTEARFLSALGKALKGLPRSERLEILADYREHFASGRSAGKTDEQIAADLGDPHEIAAEHLSSSADDGAVAPEAPRSPRPSIARIVFATLAVLLFNAIVVVGPFCGLWGGLMGLWGGFIGIIAASVRMLLTTPALALDGTSTAVSWYSAGLGMFFLSASVGCLLLLLTRLLGWLTVKYVKLNIRVVTGERRSS